MNKDKRGKTPPVFLSKDIHILKLLIDRLSWSEGE
jgi:hypothetical protein